MLLSAPTKIQNPDSLPLLKNLLSRIKRSIRNFHTGEEGMNTVEAIILLFVAAVVLVVFFTLIWPLIRDKVMEQLNSLFGQDGNG
jgi:Flp pilus assembly pilin Flp